MNLKCPHCKGTGIIECLSISEVMATRRAELGLSLRSVEHQSGVSISTISRLESGKAADWDTMVKLSKFYEISLDALAGMPVFPPEVIDATPEEEK
jgi:transcriptional regulator with XRE-family HTH domain